MGFFKKKNTPVTYNEKYLKSEIDMTRDVSMPHIPILITLQTPTLLLLYLPVKFRAETLQISFAACPWYEDNTTA